MRRLGSQLLTLSRRDIQEGFSTKEGLYVMTSLEEPITLPTGRSTEKDKEPSSIQFDTLAILPSFYSNPAGDVYDVDYMLFDSRQTHDTAYFGYSTPIPINGLLTVRFGNQDIQIRGTQQGLSFRTLAN